MQKTVGAASFTPAAPINEYTPKTNGIRLFGISVRNMQKTVGAASFTPAAPINENTPKTNGIHLFGISVRNMQKTVGTASFTPAAPINENTPKTNGIRLFGISVRNMQKTVGAASLTPAVPINENTPKTNEILRNNRKKETGSEKKIDEETKEMLQTNDLNYFENWRNKSIENTKKIKKSKCTQSNEEFETALSGQNLTVPKQQLIGNGSLKPFLYINQKKVRVKNTCSFDSIVSCVANAYILASHQREDPESEVRGGNSSKDSMLGEAIVKELETILLDT
ncbi:hypothetical protein J6590_104626 [Homalodisca vitripennis]|nr:hypothetical protein J6590_104626 [Homalodisca vitripennis]